MIQGSWRELIKRDQRVRALLMTNHHPAEYNPPANLASEHCWHGEIKCVRCQQPWPCEVLQALDKERVQLPSKSQLKWRPINESG